MTDTPPATEPQPMAAPSSPTAEDVRLMVRASNRRTIALVIPFVALVIGTVWYAAGTRAGAQDSFNSTDVLLANAPRSVCITERRNAELDAIGDLLAAGLRAQIAGLVTDDEAELQKQLTLVAEADARRVAVAESVGPEVLDMPPEEGGCGAPVLTLDDLPDDD